MKYDVVIAGGGFAGAYCAQTLGPLLGKHAVPRVALIAERNVLIFQPMLAEVAGSSLNAQDVVNPLRNFCRNITVLQGQIREIDPVQHTLRLDGGRFTRDHQVEFEHLVVALGGVTDLSKVPGMAEYAFPMKTVADALRLRSALINRLEEANLVEEAEIRTRLLTFVVVGGGYTGVETAGQMLDLLEEAKQFYRSLEAVPIRVILVHSQSELLAEIGPELGAHARRSLQRRGMEVILNARVTEVSAICATLDNGTSIATNMVVSSIGNAPNPVVVSLAQQLGLTLNKGRLPATPELQVQGQSRIWTAGDCAAVPWQDKIAPPTAQFAMRQGAQMGKNIARHLRGEPLRPFTHTFQGQLASIGRMDAVAEIYGLRFNGFIAWWLWRSAYLSKLPGLSRKLRVMIDWTMELFFPRDISLLLPPPEELLREIHVMTGECLFRLGQSMGACFFLRSGSIELTAADGKKTILGARSVLDSALADAAGIWTVDARATEPSNLMIFRGRALELLRKDVRLVPRQP